MSTTSTKRPLREALVDARELCRMIGSSAWAQLMIAGSVRRNRPEVGDVEYVVIHRMIDRPGANLFAEPAPVDLFNERLDQLLAEGKIAKHCYGNNPDGSPMYRWGAKYRGVQYKNYLHEFFGADADNWGSVLLIRTGPADYSRRVVTAMKDSGVYRQMDGYVSVVKTGERIPVSNEAAYLNLAGLPWCEPEERQ